MSDHFTHVMLIMWPKHDYIQLTFFLSVIRVKTEQKQRICREDSFTAMQYTFPPGVSLNCMFCQRDLFLLPTPNTKGFMCVTYLCLLLVEIVNDDSNEKV